jgi:hypothetical protein
LASQLVKVAPVAVITGEETPEKRDKHLAEVVALAGPAIVVATISSIKVGINHFANFPLVLFTDLSDNLEEMVQAMLRFRRKGSALARVRGFMLTNAITQPKAMRLRRKIAAIAAVIKAGAAESTLQDAFAKQNEFSPEEWQMALSDILGSKTNDDGSAE